MPEPKVVNGMTQRPMEGSSLLHTFNDPNPRSRHTTQYFEYGGNRAIYHDGWYATTLHKAFSLGSQPRASFENDTWELYNAEDDDFSLTTDLAAKHPEKVETLKALFLTEAVKSRTCCRSIIAFLRTIPMLPLLDALISWARERH